MSSVSSGGAGSRSKRLLDGVLSQFIVAADYVSDLILPPICVVCHTPSTLHGVLCPTCWAGVQFIRHPVCHRLGIPLAIDIPGENISALAVSRPPPFERARSSAMYSGVIRTMIHDFKYNDRHDGVSFMAALVHDAARELISDSDIIIPVPLSRLRLVQRRYNQSAIIARALGRRAGKPSAAGVLIRHRNTSSQVGLATQERLSNVSGAFSVLKDKRSAIRGKRVLLLDDVMTTGATVGACTTALMEAGATAVDVATVAMVVDPKSRESSEP